MTKTGSVKVSQSTPTSHLDIDENLTKFFDDYFRDLSRERKRIATHETALFIENNLPLVESTSDRFETLDVAIDNADNSGIWMELGVADGNTINHIAKKYKGVEKIYGLDSIKGLPSKWRPGFPGGSFSRETPPELNDNIDFVEGLFSESLPRILEKDKRSISFLHIDCDLYESTKSVFDLIADRVCGGTVFVFDEFFNYPGWREHEFRAFDEFIKSTNKSYEYLCYTRNHCQVAVKFI